MTLKEKIQQIIDHASESDLLEIWSVLEQQLSSLSIDVSSQRKWSANLASFYGSIQDETFERQPQPEISLREEL